jgi:uncharacterized glyoxalase superfamily protein PhnB
MTTTAVKPIPERMHSLTPHLVCAGAARAIDFYARAFGAVEEMRVPGPRGTLMHALLRIGDSALMLMDEPSDWCRPEAKPASGAQLLIHLYVDDVDATVARAAAAGATITMAPADKFWGDRYAQLDDPFGHRWAVATHTRDVSPDEIRAAMGQASA